MALPLATSSHLRNVWAYPLHGEFSSPFQSGREDFYSIGMPFVSRGHPSEVQPVIILLRMPCEAMRKGNVYVHKYLRW